MLTLLLGLALQPAPVALPAWFQDAGQKQRPIVAIGSPHPKWRSRKKINRGLNESGGVDLVLGYAALVNWIGVQAGDEGGVADEGGRDVGATAIAALALLGDGNTVRSGRNMVGTRSCIRALRGWQDAESGAIGDPASDEFLLDHALATLVLSEAYLSDRLPVQEKAATSAAQALIAARGEDGLWHLAGGDEADVDPLVTSLGAYALFAAREAGLELPDEPLEAVLAWTGELDPAQVDEAARAAALAARVFAAAALEHGLAGDEALARLTQAVVDDSAAKATDAGEDAAPALTARPDFLFLATLGLYQSDNIAWGRLSRWIESALLADLVEESEQSGYLPTGPTGRLPGGRLGATCLRVLALQNGVRELIVPVLVQ